jgi:AcrR family transcriptional regulator
MIESVAQRGYHRTTVAHVIGLAGVSRRAFYEQFSNKEECFLATYDIVVARSRKLVLESWSAERGWANRLHASCKSFLDDIVAEPKGAQLVLVDALGIGVKARERLHLAGNAYERLVAVAFRAAPSGAPLPAIASRAIVGGVRHVVFRRLREGRIEELRTLTDELLDWVEAYRSPATSRLNAIALKKPPDIAPAPAAFLAADDKRARVLGSVVHLTLDEGYGELTDHQLAQFAGISTEAFHKQFANKEACFLAVVDEFASEALEAVEATIKPISSWSDVVPVAVSSFVEHIVSHPALLRLAFIDLYEVGPGMIPSMTKSIDRFIDMLAGKAPAPRRAPEIASEAITGAVWDIVSAYSSAERMRYLPCLSDHISFVVLAPYIGPKAAIDSIEQARLGAGRRRSLAAARKLAAPPLAQPRADPTTGGAVDHGSKTVTELATKQAAKSAAKTAKPPAKAKAKTAVKRAPKAKAKAAAKSAVKKATKATAKSGRRSKPATGKATGRSVASEQAAGKPAQSKPAQSKPGAGKATGKAQANKVSGKAPKAPAKSGSKKPAGPPEEPSRRPDRPTPPRASAKRSGTGRTRPRPPK